MNRSELQAKIKKIKTQLDEMKQYKRVIEADGMKPDQADKERESALIVRLLRLERELGEMDGTRPKRKKPAPPPAKAKPTKTRRRARSGKRYVILRFAQDDGGAPARSSRRPG
jgi:hypothetical protein